MAGSEFTVTNWSEMNRAVDPAVMIVAVEVAGVAAALSPHGRTGRLASSWSTRRLGMGAWLVENPTPYARYVEYGTSRNPAVAMFGRSTAQARGRYGR